MFFYINSLLLMILVNGSEQWTILNSSVCFNEKSNQTVIQPGLISFNFHKNNHTQVYQTPKCLFGFNSIVKLFDSVDFAETLQQYENRVTRFFNPSVEKALKIYAQNYRPDTKNFSPKLYLTISDLVLYVEQQVYFLNVSEIRKIHYNQNICTLANGYSDYMFPIVETCVMRHYNHFGTMFMLALTPKFFIMSVEATFGNVIFIFGNVTDIYFKAPFRKSSFIFRQTVTDDLLIIAKKTTVFNFYPFLRFEFLDDIWKQNYDISLVILEYNKLATQYILEGMCGKNTDQKTIKLMFLFGMTHFLYSTRRNGFIPVLEAINMHQEIIIMERFLEKCFRMTKSHLLYPEIEKLQNFQPSEYHYISTNNDIPLSTKLAFLSLADGRVVTVPENKWKEIEYNVERLYAKHRLFTNLTAIERSNLFLLSEIGNSLYFHETIKRKIHMLVSSLCNPLEIILWTRMSLFQTMNIETMFTPCASSTRKDITEKYINTILSYKNLNNHKNKILNTISVYRQQKLDMFKSISCVSEKIAAFLTLPNITYVLSSQYILQGISYSVTSTVISTTIIITAIPLNQTCIPTNYKYSVRGIKPIFNVSSTNCAFCESVIVEYDDIDGIIQFVYISNNAQLVKTIDPTTNFIETNPRTHYLLLLKNGSVFEITSSDFKVNQVSIMLIILYLIIIIIVLFGIYQLIKLF
ncbi:envelope glycoprotein H [macacine betaherpesvirus 9]|uniref:Envelope glycoprotein H n=1 Tax=macacine betaherpesvirus 9 TaxID=2560568 RepID=A0A192XNQ3_9BETA|nr:envelope glycoprotein H [macacine betaherpesvirus 9]ANC96532.1 envelope glycoprotein H [macacine betaherpesvirus 9]